MIGQTHSKEASLKCVYLSESKRNKKIKVLSLGEERRKTF